MQTTAPLDSQENLATAFANWREARTQLGQLKAQTTSESAGMQFASSRQTAELPRAIRLQENICAQLWVELTSIVEKVAAARERTRTETSDAQAQLISGGRAPIQMAPFADEPVSILVVGDKTRDLTGVRTVLTHPNYRLVAASSGEDALQALTADEFACLLLDTQVPGTTGFELAELINERSKGRRVPIIILSTCDEEGQHAGVAYASGAVDYLHKPFDPAALRQKVEVFADLYRTNRRLQHRAIELERLACTEMSPAVAEKARRRTDFLATASPVLSHSLNADDMIPAVLGDGLAALGLEDDCGDARGLGIGPAPASPTAEDIRTGLRTQREWAGKDRGSIDAARVELVRDLASRAASAMENARLCSLVQESDRRQRKLLAMLAHELRNSLAPIANAAQIMEDQAAPQCTITWAQDVIVRHTWQMGRLIDDMLEVSELVEGRVAIKLETLTLASVLERAVELNAPLLHEREQPIAVELPTEAIEIQGDPERLVQALSNLINNASKFSGPNITIRIATTYANGEVQISVKDAGAGVSPEFLPHIFDLFAQGEQSLDRPHGGLGIGLTFVRHILELHRGRVAAYSGGLGKGTEAVVHLPARRVADRSASVPTIAPIAVRQKHEDGIDRVRVLVVDDHVASAETLMALLEIHGFEVGIAHEGTMALKSAEVFRPHVVLLDIGLPGMSGFEVARHLRGRPHSQDALLIALTGYGDAESQSHSLQAGFDSHMTKPADVKRLLSMLADPRATRLADAPGVRTARPEQRK